MSLIEKITGLLGRDEKQREVSPGEQEWAALLAHVVEMTDMRIADESNYQEVLLPAIKIARAYYEQSLDIVPGPVALDSAHFLLPRIFPNPENIPACLGRSLAVKNELPAYEEAECPRLYALLGVRIKRMSENEQVFTDHTVRSLAASPGQVRQMLKEAAFDSLLQGFANENLHYEKKLEQARAQYELLQTAGVTARHAEDANVMQQGKTPPLVRAYLNKSAEQVLFSLREWLYSPQHLMRINMSDGFLVQEGSKNEEEWRLPLMVTQDRRQWNVCLISFPIVMARKALKAEAHNHRFMLI
ncbi:MAG: hypothetical protein LBJ59_10780 [Zoogloeaceae bacterium]|jgi:hypothetical protein|nr:hypothetical protein [Zoogloeaceae bacterium]